MPTNSKRSTRGVWIAAGAALALGAATTAAPADAAPAAAIEDDQLVSAPLEQIPQRIKRMKQTGARYTHVDVFWNEVARGLPRKAKSKRYSRAVARNHRWRGYDFGRIDTIMVELRKRKIKPIMQVYSSPRWANGGKIAPVSPIGGFRTQYVPWAPKPRYFADFMYAMAKRYNGRTILRRDGKRVRMPRARHFEIWNEANLKSFFRVGGGSNVRAYAKLVAAAAPQIDRAQRRSRPKPLILAGTFGPRSSGGNGNIGALTWWKRLLRNRAFRKHTDVLTGHFYPSVGPLRRSPAFPSWSTLNLMIEQADRYRQTRGKKIMITEAGYTTKRTPFRARNVTLRQQASYIRQIFLKAIPREEAQARRNNRARGYRTPVRRVSAVVIFNMVDNPAWPGGLWTEDFRRKKPSFRAFKSIARRPIPKPLRSSLRV